MTPNSHRKWILVLLVVLPLGSGCAWNIDTVRNVVRITNGHSRTGVEVRRRPRNRLEKPINWWSNLTGQGGLKPDDRTLRFLGTYDLEGDYESNPSELLSVLQEKSNREPNLDLLHTIADLAYIEGHESRLAGNEQYAGQMLSLAVSASYRYLFDRRLDRWRNVYDPSFRRVCDIYNESLEGLLRMMRDQDALRPGGRFTATTIDGKPLEVLIKVRGRWEEEELESFEFVTDFDTRGLRNVHHTFGLGVPLIGIRGSAKVESPDDQYYPEGLSVPLTAFVRTHIDPAKFSGTSQFEIHLIDPLEQTGVKISDRLAPLESDITTPLAYYLNDPLLDANWFATAALLNGDFARQFGGLYMLEPYDPAKIPVVMVHGFWSSPMTWTEMFNDLRADKAIRDHYQFWFYLYPSGQPFWFSARQMRSDLADLRRTVDPSRSSLALNEMVLVGHSMGGLVSRLQTIHSRDDFWNLVSDRRIDELEGDPETIQLIHDTLYFQANPSIARVITIGTPHRGSVVSNSLTRWLSEKLIALPSNITSEYAKVMNKNPDFFTSKILKIRTSTDALSPDSRFFDAMLHAETSDRVTYHNIIGVADSGGASAFFGGDDKPTDGVVSFASAHAADAVSQIKVPAEHSEIHQHPRAILEVRRILHEHLDQFYGSTRTAERQVVYPADRPVEPTMNLRPDSNLGDQ